MGFAKMLAAIANATGWSSLSQSNITSSDLSSTFGSAYDDNFSADVQKLDTNKVVILYAFKDLSDNGDSGVVVATVDPATGAVTFGTPVVFGAIYANSSSNTPFYMFGKTIAILSTTSFVIGWTNGNGEGKCRAATVSGTTITPGTTINIQTTSAVTIRYIHAVALDSTRVVFVYRQWGTTNMRASLHTISGTTMTYHSVVTLTSNVAYTIDLIKLDSTRVFVCLSNGSDAGYNRVVVVTYSGTTISAGTSLQLSSTSFIADMVGIALDSSNVIAFFEQDGTYGFRRFSISGTTITQLSSNTVYFGSQFPTATYSLRSAPTGARVTLLKQEGASYYIAICSHIGTSESTVRPMICIFRITPSTETITLVSYSYMFQSSSTYIRWAASIGAFAHTALSDSFLVGFGFFVTGSTYTMKLVKFMV